MTKPPVKLPIKTFGEYSEGCPDKLGIPIERRPANALCVEYMEPAPRCKQQSPDGRGSIWLLSGGSPLAYGRCCRSQCPRLAERDSLDAMAREFEETVKEIVDRISGGHVLLTERVRSGHRRAISVGPYRTATSTKRQYGLIVTPPPAGADDLHVYSSADRAAREFVRFVGVSEAKSTLTREARKSVHATVKTTNDHAAADLFVEGVGHRLPRGYEVHWHWIARRGGVKVDSGALTGGDLPEFYETWPNAREEASIVAQMKKILREQWIPSGDFGSLKLSPKVSVTLQKSRSETPIRGR